MTRADLAGLLLLISHGAVMLCGYSLGRIPRLRRRRDLSPRNRRRRQCPLCWRFVGAPPHCCPHRFAVR